MPYAEIGRVSSGCSTSTGDGEDEYITMRIFYRLFGRGSNKVILIRGLQGTHEGWRPQLYPLVGTEIPNEEEFDAPWPWSEPSDSDTSDGRTSASDSSSLSSFDSGAAEAIGRSGPSKSEQGRKSSDGVQMESKRVISPAQMAGARGRQVCIFDNRGAGRSTIPPLKADYSTTIMAKDALALMDHLGWQKAHVIGLSMGGMIASKLAATAPHRVRSLALISTSGGKWDAFGIVPMATLAYQFVFPKTREQWERQYLCTQFFKEMVCVNAGVLSNCLLPQTVEEGFVPPGAQPLQGTWRDGMKGHHHACWHHCLTDDDVRVLKGGGFLISLIHGSVDIVAPFPRAELLAKRLAPSARLVAPVGGHLVIQECTEQVDEALIGLLEAAEAGMDCKLWSQGAQLPQDNNGNGNGWHDDLKGDAWVWSKEGKGNTTANLTEPLNRE